MALAREEARAIADLGTAAEPSSRSMLKEMKRSCTALLEVPTVTIRKPL